MPRTRSEQEAVARAITMAFEGAGFVNLAGNFDGQGWSLGALQWNFGQGTLQPLILAMEKEGPRTFRELLTVTHQGKAYDLGPLLLEACRMPKAQAVAWADARCHGPGKRQIVEPWRTGLAALLAHPGMQQVQIRAMGRYMDDARSDCAHFGLNTMRDLILFHDIAVQNGPGKVGKVGSAATRQAFERLGGMDLPPAKRREAIARAVADTANPRWRNDVLSRKMTIVRGAGTVHGRTYDLERQYGPLNEVLV